MNSEIEELVQAHLAIVEADSFADIEEVMRVKAYISNLEEKRVEIQNRQIEVRNHYTLLDKY